MKKITGYAKKHRKLPTPAEKELRKKLLRWKISFRSQRPFDFFIVDFLIPDRRLVIEVDGGYHDEVKIYDKKRETYLKNLGLKVIRISNDEVLKTDCQKLLDVILSYPIQNILGQHWKIVYGQAKY